jgi:hypothetical protein
VPWPAPAALALACVGGVDYIGGPRSAGNVEGDGIDVEPDCTQTAIRRSNIPHNLSVGIDR